MTLPHKNFGSKIIVDLQAANEQLLARFDVGALTASRLLWLNKRWFLESGIDIALKPVRQDLQDWLLATYAVSSLRERCVTGSFGKMQLGADRYGASGGSTHGGSGRCGIQGLFNAKGIGRTPLVADNVDWAHSHGCLYLYDAIREAVASEIVNAELPGGANAVVAIIDAGYCLEGHEGSERCGILVRSNFIRLAHFERSVFFGSSGVEHSDQHKDSQRVQAMVRSMTSADDSHSSDSHSSPDSPFDLVAVFKRLAEQIGVSRAHRLWNGRPTTDNFTVDGAYLDFGGFRSLANWKAADDGRGQVFGKDTFDLEKATTSLIHFFKKHSPHQSWPEPLALSKVIGNHIESSFKRACAEACALPWHSSAGREFSEIMLSYYRSQQRRTYLLNEHSSRWDRKDWIYHQIGSFDDAPSPQSSPNKWAARTRDLLLNCRIDEAPPGPARLASAKRWLQPRHLQYYQVSKKRAKRMVRKMLQCLPNTPDSIAAGGIADFIEREVAMSRRVWPALEKDQIILGFSTDIASSALFTYDLIKRCYQVILTGTQINGALHVFGSLLPIKNFSGARSRPLEIRCPCGKESWKNRQQLSAYGENISIPRAAVTFAEGILAAENIHQNGVSRHG